MIIVGIDPSLSNFGLAKGHLNPRTGVFDLHELRLQESAANKKSAKVVRKNSDDLERARLLYKTTTAFVADADLVMVEIPVGSQSARAMASYGACIGLLASITKPLIQVTPNEVKLASVGSKTATKAEMIAWAVEAYPNGDWLKVKRNGEFVIVNKNEHLADAVAAIHAGVRSETFQQLLTFQRTII